MTTIGRREEGCVRRVTVGRLEKLEKEKNWRRNVTIALWDGKPMTNKGS